MSSWRQLDPSLKRSNLVRHMIAHHLSVPSTLEVYRIRQFFDYLVTTFTKRRTNVIAVSALTYVKFINKEESCLQRLIDRKTLSADVI